MNLDFYGNNNNISRKENGIGETHVLTNIYLTELKFFLKHKEVSKYVYSDAAMPCCHTSLVHVHMYELPVSERHTSTYVMTYELVALLSCRSWAPASTWHA